MKAGRLKTFRKILLPAAAPQVFSGLWIGVEMSFFILIAAEMTGATAGLGWIIHSAGALYQVPRIYGGRVVRGPLGRANQPLSGLPAKGLFFWKESVDPIAGASRPEEGGQPISVLKLSLAAGLFVLVLAIGIHQIVLAELRLNDPTIIPEYRVWTE
jgi:NitT/TauT family transport system permease protein